MATRIRLASFNLENPDDAPGARPSLAERIALMRPQLVRIQADVLCRQEGWAQPDPTGALQLLALDQFVAGRRYQAYNRIVGTNAAGTANRERNSLIHYGSVR